MSVIPKKKVERIEFCEDHVEPWTANAVAIGTNALVVATFASKTEAARTAYESFRAAQDAAGSAAIDYNVALAAMTDAASDIIKLVRAKAATGGDPIYALAALPVPATPSPRPAPGTPYEFAAGLDGDGSVLFLWKCTNPTGTAGTMYEVCRQVGGVGEFALLGVTGERQFLDMTIPVGTTRITYKVRGVRSTTAGSWATFNVFFGIGASEVTVTQGAVTILGPKLAA